MKRFTLISIALAALALFANAQQTFFQPIEKYKLKNGLEIIFAEFGTLPITTVDIYINTGKKNELPGMQSIANITATALTLGSKNYSRAEQDAWLEKMGTSISAESNDSYTHISTNLVNSGAEKGIDLLAGIILHPTFPKEDINQMIKQNIDYNKPSRMDINNLAAVFSDLFVYGSANPLGRYFYATQLSKINRDTIEQFYKFNYTPKNTKIVISGKPEKEKIKKLIDQYFSTWQAAYGEVNGVSYDMLPIKKKEYAFVNKTKAKQVALQWNKKAPDAKSKDIIAFNVATIVFNEILFNEIRAKKGYTYGIRLSYSPENNNGIYIVTTMVRNEVAYDCIVAFDKVIADFFTNGITSDKLEKVKIQFKGNYIGVQTPANYVSIINPQVYPDYQKRSQFLNEVDALNAETINKVIKKYFTPDSYKLLIAGDETNIADQLSKINGLIKYSLKDIETNN